MTSTSMTVAIPAPRQLLCDFSLRLTESKLPELKALGLVDDTDIDTLNESRKAHVAKIESGLADKHDCLDFIYLEVELLVKIQTIRQERDEQCKQYELDFCIIDNLRQFHLNLVWRYPEDYEMWIKYFRFCAKFKLWDMGSQQLSHFLEQHGDKPQAWLYACDWDLRANNRNRSKKWLKSGIEKHPANVELNDRFIRDELNEAKDALEFRKNRPDSHSADVKNLIKGKDAEGRYMIARELITDSEFYLKLLDFLKTLPCAAQLKEIVTKDVLDRFDQSEDVWVLKARRVFPKHDPDLAILSTTKINYREQVETAVSIFKEAVQRLNTKKMWNGYMDFIEEIQEDPRLQNYINLKRNAWKSAIADGDKAKRLEARHYLNYKKGLESFGLKLKLRKQLLEMGTTSVPESIDLWHARLQLLIRENQTGVAEAFWEAVEVTKDVPAEQAVKLWHWYISYVRTFGDDEADELFQKGLNGRQDVAQLLKPAYLQFIFLVDGIGDARKLADNPLISRTPCLQFYLELAKLEAMQPEPSKKAIRNSYETAIKHFGSQSAELWCDYIAFELSMGDFTKISVLHRNASRLLPEDLMAIVQEKFPSDQIYE